MQTETLAGRLGTTVHLSSLLHKAMRVGLAKSEDLEQLAMDRGCSGYFESRYPSGDESGRLMEQPAKWNPPPSITVEQFSNAELAAALLSICLPYSQHRLRMGAAILGTPGVDARRIARLALLERNEQVVRHIANCGNQVEPNNEFWSELLRLLPQVSAKPHVLPDISRFVSMTGYTRRGKETVMRWVRPVRSHAA